MRTSKRILVFITFNVILASLLCFCLRKPSANKILINLAKDEKYDVLVLGESHGETSINPFVLSEELNCETFNLSRRVMPFSYIPYILEEVNQNHQYRKLILDIDPSYWIIGDDGLASSDVNLLACLSGKNRVNYLIDNLLDNNYNDVIFDYEFNTNIIRKIPTIVKLKLSDNYRNNSETVMEDIYNITGTSNSYKYYGRGFRYGLKESTANWSPWSFNKNDVTNKNMNAFNKIVNYCRNNDIELICIQSALPKSRVLNENLDDVNSYFSELCDSYNLKFYDMNYVKKEYLLKDDSCFTDADGHMMGEFADKHTMILTKILNSSKPEEYFYENYNDVLDALK